MLSIRRSAKFSSYVSAVIAIFVVISCSTTLFYNRTSAGDEEKTGDKAPQVNGKGSADKKDEPARALAKFMRQKLHASNQILEGLCTEDLQMVTEGSQTLMKMSGEERWRVSNDIMYRRYSNEFGQAVEELRSEAEDNDMDGTSLAWVNVTMKCLKCHEWVRNTILVESQKQDFNN